MTPATVYSEHADMVLAHAIPSSSVVSQADIVFLHRFETCQLPESEWSHLAHVRVAWTCLAQSESREAIARIRRGILRYNTYVLNRRHKYHETVTVAFTRIVASEMRSGEPWRDFSARIGGILDRESPVLDRYYSKSLLNSEEARTRFLEPDLENLPEIS